ncbi:YDG domain-containing protein [Paraburkholderia sp. DHOC27]|uniref:YDG domain-containing protein n=1 Tax=Paraburkholderia sp. DHOC27 TaxID=2303330 RepID=UPI0015F34951|nr:YDG domain-containing protein [Paraburkholderia sp. DHOC27]
MPLAVWLCLRQHSWPCALLLALGVCEFAQAAGPTGGQITAGSGHITQAGNSTTIQQGTPTLSLSWQSFNLAPNQTVTFVQPGAGSIAVNRILGNTASNIFGHLNANGQVWLINPNGVLFGPGASVNVGGLVASTLDVADSALGSSSRTFAGSGKGSVVNQGAITAATGGYVALLGNQVSNQGTISAHLGTVALAGGSAMTLTFSGNQLLHLSVDQSTLDNLAENRQLIVADGGDVLMSAGAKDAVMASLVNNSGVIQAQTVQNHGGTITLLGGMTAGTVDVGGKLDASAPNGGNGGAIETSAAHFSVADGAQITASAPHGKAGTWLVDPTDLTIDPTAAATLSSTLDGGTSVTEQTTATGATGVGTQSAGAGDINVDAPITWSSAAANLTLQAFNAINVNAPVTGAGSVTMDAAGSNLTIAAGGSIKGGAGVTLATAGNFVNNAGSGAVSTGTTAPWLIYSSNPALDTAGGIVPDFIQYNATYSTSATTAPAASGNGFLYSLAPTLSITGLTGTVTKVYDGTTTASLTGANFTTTGLVNGNTIATATGSYANANAGSGIGVSSPANIAAITLTDAGGTIPVFGYRLAGAPVTASIGVITPAPLTATIVGDPTKVYNDTTTASLTSANYTVTGFVAGQGATLNPPGGVAYASVDAGTQTVSAPLTASNFNANTNTNLANYILPKTATGPGTITPAPLIITGVLANDKTYDGTTAASLNTSAGALFGVLAQDAGTVALNLASLMAAFTSPNAGNDIAVAVSGGGLTGTKAADYFISPASFAGLSADITPKALTVSGATASNKVYDATNAATLNLSAAALSGLVPGDAGNVSLSGAGASGTFSQSNVGNNLPVTVSGFTLSGTAARNYAFTQPTGITASITPAALVIGVSGNPTKVYDGTTALALSPADMTVSGFVGGQGATVSQASAASYATPNAGSGIGVTVSFESSDLTPNPGTALSNYTISTTAVGTGTITPAPLTGMLVGNPTKTFDGTAAATLSPANYALSGLIGNQSMTVTQTAGTYDSANAGVQGVSAALGAADYQAGAGTLLSNYILPTTMAGVGTITRAALTGTLSAAITGNPTKVYDGTTVATLAPANFTLSGFVGSDSATVNQSVSGQYGSKNVGLQPVSANLSEADFTAGAGTNLNNYTFPVVAFGTGTILPAPLSVSIINNPTKVYNGTTTVALNPGNFQINGFVPGEGAQINATTPFAYASANAGAEAVSGNLTNGNYVANTGTLLSNYVLASSASGAGTILQAPLFITGVYATSKVYDTTTSDTLNVASAGLAGLVSTDVGKVTLTTSNTGTFAQANVGNGIAVTAGGFSIAGSAFANYALQPVSGLSANITPAPLTLTGIVANNKVYDATTAATLNTSNGVLNGVLGSDSVSFSETGAAAQFRTANVGSGLSVTVGGFTLGGASAGNYMLTQPAGLTASITPAPITAVITGTPTKLYDGDTTATLTAQNYVLSGFVNGQGATVPQQSGASYTTANAGTGLGLTSALVISDFLANAGTNLSNYSLPTTATGDQGVITPRVINLTGTRVYDSTTGAAATLFGNGGVLSGIDGQTLTLSGSGTLTTKNVGNQQPFAAGGLNGFTLTGNNGAVASNYTFVGGTDWVTITPATLSVSGATAASKTYDGSTAATVSGATLTGVLGTDAVTLGNATSGTFASKNAGNGIAVSTSMTISGTDASNYIILQPVGLTASIAPLAITVSASGQDKSYSGTTTAGVTLSSSGVIPGDSVSFTDTGANFSTSNVGTGIPISVTGIAGTGADAGNYTLTNTTATTQANITPDVLNLTSTRVYDTTTGAAATLFGNGGVLSGVDGETLTLSDSGTLASKNVGTQQPFAVNGLNGFTLTGNNGATASNYTLVGGMDWVTITPAILTVSGTAASNKIYDGTTAATLSGATLQGVLGTDAVTLGNDTTGTFASKNVGNNIAVSTAMTLNGADAGNYLVVQPAGLSASILPLAISVTATGINKVYDGTTTAGVTLSSSGLVAGDRVTFTDTGARFSSPNVGTAVPISVTGIADAGTDAGNYTLLNNAAAASANITPAILNLTATRVYDATTGAGAALFGNDGVLTGVNGETLTLGGSGTLSTKNVGTQQAFAVNGLNGFTLSGNGTALASNYTFAGGTDWVTITPATLTVLGTVAGNKVYNGNTVATLSGSTLQGVLSIDNVTLGIDTTGTFASKNVGNNIAVSTGMTISGTDAGNYVIVQPAGLTASITPLAIIVSATGQSKVYDGTTTAGVSLSSNGVLPGDSLSFTESAANFSTPNVGTAVPITVSGISGTGTGLGNYTFNTTATTSANIAPAILNLTGARVYDGTTGAAASVFGNDGVLTGVDGQTLTLRGNGTLSTKNVGTQQPFAVNGLNGYTLTGNGSALASNYTFVGGMDWVTITPLAITVTVTGQNKVYDGNTTAAVTLSGSGALPGDALTFTDTAASFNTPNAGNGIPITVTGITGSGADLANYTFSTTATGSANITPAILSLTGTRVYDGTTSASASLFGSNGVLTGVNGETLTLSGTGTLTTKNVGTQQPFAASGTSGLTLTGNGTALASNYTFAGGTDWVTITPLAITVTATGQNKVYDGTTTAGVSLNSSGIIPGDSLTFTDSAASFSTANAGNGIPITVTGISGSGADLGNYTFGTAATASANITPSVLNLTASRAYDGTSAANANLFGNNGTLSGVNGETLALGGAGTLSSRNVGNEVSFAADGLSGFTLSGNGATLASNYTLTGGTDWVSINPALLSVVGTTASNRVYDGTTVAGLSGATLSGLFGQDAVTLGNATAGTFNNKNVGSNKPVTTAMTISGADAGNYILLQPTGLTASITPLGILVNATGNDKVYDGTTLATVTLSSAGVVPGDQVNFSSMSASFADSNAANGISVAVGGISERGADAGNYTLLNSTATTTANITPLPITVTATGTSKVYDGNDSDIVTLTSNGILAGDKLQFSYGAADFSNPDVGNGKPVTVTGISDSGANAQDYVFNTSALTAANITSPGVGGPLLGLAQSGFQESGTGVTVSGLAQTQSLLQPEGVETPYGVANQDDTGIYTGNRQPKDSAMPRNRIPADFHPGLGLTVIQGGVRLPADAGP